MSARLSDDRQRLSGVLIVVLAALTAVGPLTINLYLPAFPEVATDLGASDATVQLTMTAMPAGLGIGQLVLGSFCPRRCHLSSDVLVAPPAHSPPTAAC